MGLTTFRTMTSGLDIAVTGSSVAGETHSIPVSAPYAVYIDRIPKISSTGTSFRDNTYVSVADMATAGITCTIAGGAATITTNAAPSAGEAYFQITNSDYPFSTKIGFNATDAGKAFVVLKNGYGKVLKEKRY